MDSTQNLPACWRSYSLNVTCMEINLNLQQLILQILKTSLVWCPSDIQVNINEYWLVEVHTRDSFTRVCMHITFKFTNLTRCICIFVTFDPMLCNRLNLYSKNIWHRQCATTFKHLFFNWSVFTNFQSLGKGHGHCPKSSESCSHGCPTEDHGFTRVGSESRLPAQKADTPSITLSILVLSSKFAW